jgi:hypothetical protein
MKNLLTNQKRLTFHLSVLTLIAVALLALPLLSSAHSNLSSITVTNNSNRQITHIYFSSVDQDDWGPDQLNNATLGNGQSVTLSNAPCDGSEIKVIGEDSDGCFVSAVVSCSGNAAWTITDSTPADCGSE